jgi:hypothetical protein
VDLLTTTNKEMAFWVHHILYLLQKKIQNRNFEFFLLKISFHDLMTQNLIAYLSPALENPVGQKPSTAYSKHIINFDRYNEVLK